MGENTIGDDWEKTIGKVRGSVKLANESDSDDTEMMQESTPPFKFPFSSQLIINLMTRDIAFPSHHLSFCLKGINISNTNFKTLKLKSSTQVLLKGSGSNVHKEWSLSVCAVVEGQMKIKFRDQDFYMGKGGIWRVRDGETCLIGNADGDGPDGIEDTIVHVFSVE